MLHHRLSSESLHVSHTAGHLNMSDKVEVPVLALAQVCDAEAQGRVYINQPVATVGSVSVLVPTCLCSADC